MKITFSQSTGTTRPSMISKPCGVCIQLFDARIQVAEISVPERDHDGREEMQPWPDLVPAEQHDAEEARLEEEGGQHLIGEQRAGDAAGEGGEIAPVRAELVGHHQAGDDAHGEVDGEDLRPEMIEIAIDRRLSSTATSPRARRGSWRVRW